MKYLKYLSYVIRHKWYVMIECFKVNLWWQGIIHDLSKLLPSEFFPYANYFYWNNNQKRDETGYYKPTDTGDKAFDFAWLLHQKRNKHHWQWWILPEDEGGIRILDMPLKYREEMLCDWRGAGRAQGYGDNTKDWYEKNKNRMLLNNKTRDYIEKRIKGEGGNHEG